MIAEDLHLREDIVEDKVARIVAEVGPIAGRVPLLPIETLERILASADPTEASRKFLATNELARRAIVIGSSSLGSAVGRWIKDGKSRSESLPLRALAYLIRMASRPTPYGIFAGIGLAELGPNTTLTLALDARRTQTRPDMQVLSTLKDSVERGPRRGHVRYVANEAVVKRGGRLYVANVLLTTSVGEFTEQRSISLKETPVVSHVRRVARSLVAYDELLASVCGQFGCDIDEARRTLDALVKAGLLISELQASPVGDPIGYTLERLAVIDPTLAAPLEKAVQAIRSFDADAVEQQSVDKYNAAANSIGALTEGAQEPLLQVDMRVEFDGHVGASILEEARHLSEYLLRMGAMRSMKRYREQFVQRYEGTERMVPLLELVDANIGLGAPSRLDVVEPHNAKRDALLSYIAGDAARRACTEIELSHDQFDIIAPPPRVGEAGYRFEVAFQIAAESRTAIERGEYLVVPSGFIGSLGQSRSLGRFLDLLGPEVTEQIRARKRSEKTILAELNYPLAESRMYNVSIRPQTVDFEIRIGIGEPGSAKQISLDDLWVGIDESERFFLWSAALSRRVEPTETHMFNTQRLAPNLCQFLALLDSDGTRGFGRVWWGPAAAFTMLPRVRLGRVVLSPQQWRFPRSEFGSSAESVEAALDRVREAWWLPKHVVIGYDDHLLTLDLDSPITSRLLHDQLKRSDDVVVQFQEMLPCPSQAWLTAQGGSYLAEFAVTFDNVCGASAATSGGVRKPIIVEGRRHYGPGSEWIYAKIYTGSQAVENLLTSTIGPFVRELESLQSLKIWFFVRYADSESHLRLRIRPTDRARSDVERRVVTLCQQLLDSGEVTRFVLDTYEPEYERYGGVDRMAAVEDFFHSDSEICLRTMMRPGRTIDHRVEGAVETFLPWLGNVHDLYDLVKKAFAHLSRAKTNANDRLALKRLTGNNEFSGDEPMVLRAALTGEGVEQRLRSLFHMHCNRLGLSGPGESRATALLRSVALAHIARIEQRPKTVDS